MQQNETKYVKENMEKTVKNIVYYTSYMSNFRDAKIYLQSFGTNTYQPMLWGSCGDQMKKERIVKDIKLE
jgi:hypothetical protein